MSCLDDSTVVRFIAGQLDEPVRRVVEDELGRCRRCAALVAAVVRSSATHPAQSGRVESSAVDQTGDPADLDGDLADDAPAARYVVGVEIARGGMGTIVAAFDRQLARSIAIKRLERDDAALATRFAREIRVTASLQHPGIVPIYDSGVLPGGQPFYAMRHVPGASLEHAIAERRSASERLELLVPVLAAAEAVGYAHERGIIHRDLTPSNILVGPFGETVLIDWGLARITGDASDDPIAPEAELDPVTTRAGAVLGTPRYMSPEQARGEPATRRSDVFSIGAILYHTLSGRPPVVGDEVRVVIDRVARADFPPLSRIVPRLPSDLLAIVERAMSARAELRYASAGELAADLRRFQTGQLVAAYSYSRRDLVWRFVRRYRALVFLAVLFATVVAAGGALSIRRIVSEREQAEEARSRAERERAGAEDLSQFLLHDLRKKLTTVGRLDALAGVADRVDAYYKTTAAGRAELPEAMRERAALWDLRAAVASGEGDAAAAIEHLERGLALIDRVPSSSRTDEIRGELLGSKALRTGEAGDFAQARALYLEAAELHRRISSDDPERQRKRDLDVAYRLIGAARMSERLARHADTDREYQAAADLLQPRVAAHPDDLEAAGALGAVRLGLGQTRYWRGQLDEARAFLDSAIADGKALAAREPKNTRHQYLLAWSYLSLSSVTAAKGNLDEAQRLREQALEVASAMVTVEPASAEWQQILARASMDLGAVAVTRSDWSTAAKRFTAARPAYAQLIARDPSNRHVRRAAALAAAQLAVAERSLGRTEAARAAWRDALADLAMLARSGNPEARVEWAYGLRGYAGLERLARRLGAAEEAIAQAVSIVDETPAGANRPGDRFYRAVVLAESGMVHKARGRRRDAVAAWSRAAAMLRDVAARVPLQPEWAHQLRAVETELAAAPARRPPRR